MDSQMKEQLMPGATPVGLPEGGQTGLPYLGTGSEPGARRRRKMFLFVKFDFV